MPELTYRFPLHIAQMMSDVRPNGPPAISLLPASAVPLNLRETLPPADQIPALRPQLTSPIVENEISGILDNVEREGITAVGIVATDERDVLFLARLLKRQAPNVQLFLTSSNLLYLHSDYLPYMRGTLVASTYPLHLPIQTRGSDKDRTLRQTHARKLFQSGVAEAVFNATQIQPGGSTLLDYCDPSADLAQSASALKKCVPPVWVSIIGDDGFWPLSWQPFEAKGQTPVPVKVAGAGVKLHIPPLSGPLRLFSVLLLLIIGIHAGIVLFAWTRLPDEASLRQLQHNPLIQFQRNPYIRLLAPPITYAAASRRHTLALLFGFLVLAELAIWVTGILGMHAAIATELERSIVMVSVVLTGTFVMTPAVLMARRPHGVAEPFLPCKEMIPSKKSVSPSTRFTGPVAQERKISRLMFVTMVLLLVATLAFFGQFLWTRLLSPKINPAQLAIDIERFASNTMVSPTPAILCLFAAIYAAVFAGLRRVSLLGSGYAALAEKSATFRLLAGSPVAPPVVPCGGQSPTGTHTDVTQLPLVRLLDMPAQNLPWPYPVGMIVFLLGVSWAVSGPSSVDGMAFSRFLICASALVFSSAFLQLAQAIEIWRRLRPGLTALSHSRIEPALGSVAKVVRWNLSIVSPHLSDLAPLASLADQLHGRLLIMAAAGAKIPRMSDPSTSNAKSDRELDNPDVLRGFLRNNGSHLFRDEDVDSAADVTRPLQLAELNREMEQQEYAPLLQSKTWFQLWAISDQLVGLLAKVHWSRCECLEARSGDDTDAPSQTRHLTSTPDKSTGTGVAVQDVTITTDSGTHMARLTMAIAKSPVARDIGERPRRLGAWLDDCQTLIALQCGLVLRDILARVMSCLFVAMLCLTLLTAAHLVYLFQGRSSFLTVDLIAVTCASAIAIWLLVAMERDAVLSRLRHTTPGRVDINWEFLKRVGFYGVLPLVAVLGSLFPEIQEPILGWMEPLRKLVNF